MWNYSGVCDVMFVNTSVIVKGTWLTQVELLKPCCAQRRTHTLARRTMWRYGEWLVKTAADHIHAQHRPHSRLCITVSIHLYIRHNTWHNKGKCFIETNKSTYIYGLLELVKNKREQSYHISMASRPSYAFVLVQNGKQCNCAPVQFA